MNTNKLLLFGKRKKSKGKKGINPAGFFPKVIIFVLRNKYDGNHEQ